MVVFSVGVVAALPRVRPLWRHETTFYDQTPSWWQWSDGAWKGWVRAMPVGALAAAMMVPAGWIAVLEWRSPITDTILVALGVGSLVAVAGVAAIMLWNRPKFLVPPYRRHELGIVAARRRRRPSNG